LGGNTLGANFVGTIFLIVFIIHLFAFQEMGLDDQNTNLGVFK